MPTSQVALRCTCGQVQGTITDVSSANVNRVVCYCEDCQCFAHFLNAEQPIVDKHGGSDIVQVSQANVSIDTGWQHVACMRLSPKGTVRR